MAKISAGYSITAKLGSNYVKVNLDVADINTELPLQEQLDGANTVSTKVLKYLQDKVDKKIEEAVEEFTKEQGK